MGRDVKIIDISLMLQGGLVTYPKDVPFARRIQRDQEEGDSSTVSVLETSAHAGTHIDAPRHFFSEMAGVDGIPLEYLYGPCFVADCRGSAAVTREQLEAAVPAGVKRLLLKTDNSAALAADPTGPFNKEFVYVDRSAAEFCLERGMVLVGIDYLSIDQSGNAEKPAHNLLLPRHVVILEGIVLDGVEAGEYFLACGALNIKDADGSPARVVLLDGWG